MKNARLILILLSCLLAPGCFVSRERTNRPLAPAEVQQVVAGVSAEKVVEILGAPTEVVQLGRRSAYRYDFTQRKRSVLFLLVVGFLNEDAQQDRVWVFLDEEQRVSHVGATFDGDEPEHEMPWSD